MNLSVRVRTCALRLVLLTACHSGGASEQPAVDASAGDSGHSFEGSNDAGHESHHDAQVASHDDASVLAHDGGGQTDDAGPVSDGDIPPTHTLHVTASKEKHSHSFLPKDADPSVPDDTFSADHQEVAEVDARAATMMGKLIINLGGSGSTGADTGGVSAFAVDRGFHAFAVAYDADYNILINDPDYYGDARREEFDGVDHTSSYAERDGKPEEKLGLSAADGVLQRVTMGLRFLAKNYADEDWGYFLTQDGEVRWSDVIFAGFSHGASSAARFAMLVRASRALSFSGPRDNTCNDLTCSDPNSVIASWFSETPKTPIERFYAITGGQDGQHTQHLVAFEKLGYLGQVVDVESSEPPYDNSHRLTAPSSNHSGFCGDDKYRDVCNYMLGVPPENQAGIP